MPICRQIGGHSAVDQPIAYIANGHVYTVKPNGAGLLDVVTSGASYGGKVSHSPDSKHLAFRLDATKGFKQSYNAARVPVTGGSIVNLTADLGDTNVKSPVGWCQ